MIPLLLQLKTLCLQTIAAMTALISLYMPFGGIGEPIPVDLQLKAPVSDVIWSQDIDWIVQKPDMTYENKGKIKQYLYKDTQAPKENFQGLQEDVDKRTITAQFFPNGAETTGKFYSSPQFYKDGNKWYHIQFATTSIEAFNQQMPIAKRILNRIFNTAYATNYSSAGGDGPLEEHKTTWAAARESTSCTYPGGTAVFIGVNSQKLNLNYWIILRSELPFDTTALPSGSTITAAAIHLFDYNLGDYGSPILVTVLTGQANPAALAAADYGTFDLTTPAEGAGRITMSPQSLGYEWTATLNATGYTWIIPGGYSLFGFQEAKDADNTTPTSEDHNYFCSSRHATTGYRPYLAVTYTEAGAAYQPPQEIIMFE